MTELLIFHRPFNSLLSQINIASATSSTYNYTERQNQNIDITGQFIGIARPASQGGQGSRLDLYEDVAIPLSYTILDIREPDKRKTSWSKSIKLPGTKNNNRLFKHIYELGNDGWTTIGNRSVYQGFNPNVRKEVILNQDSLQIFKGNMQLKGITKDANDNIEYEIVINGDLTSLFFDVGNSKLTDLTSLTQWNHDWSKDNIQSSWSGRCAKADGSLYQSITWDSVSNVGVSASISHFFNDTLQFRQQYGYTQSNTGRLVIRTWLAHGLSEEDWVRIAVAGASGANEFYMSACGDWAVAEILDNRTFTVNYPYPLGLLANPNGNNVTAGIGYLWKANHSGRGFVYPMISWGDEYDFNSFPVTSFVPGFYLKEIWDAIMEQTNSHYESNFLESQFFKRLFLIQKKSSYDINPYDVAQRSFRVGTNYAIRNKPSYNTTLQWYYLNTAGRTSSTATASLTPLTDQNSGILPFEKENGVFGTGSFYDGSFGGFTSSQLVNNWDESSYRWKVQKTGEYKLSANINLSVYADMQGYYSGTGTASFVGTSSIVLGTASFSPTNTQYTYTPTVIRNPRPWGPLTNQYGSQTLGIGVVVKATIWRVRAGQKTEIGSSIKSFATNTLHTWKGQAVNQSPAGWKYFGRYQPLEWENQTMNVRASNEYFQKGDEVYIQVSQFLQAPAATQLPSSYGKKCLFFSETRSTGFATVENRDIMADVTIDVNYPSVIWNEPSTKSTENSTLEATSILPKDMTCKDFLLTIIKMFNLHIESDRLIERKYYIEPRDDFYATGSGGSTDYVDWSDQVKKDSVNILPMGELTAKYYTFENAAETDYWNKKFKDDRGRDYMKYTKEIDNDFLKNEQKISIPIGSTVMINNPETSDIVTPAILQMESNGSFKPVSNSKPRILIWAGMRPYTGGNGLGLWNLSNPNYPGQKGWELLSSVNVVSIGASSSQGIPQYPYAGTVDSPQDPMWDINWFNMEEGDFVYWDKARWSDNNLYNRYWRNFITEISDPASVVVQCEVFLKPTDIAKLDFRKIYVIDGHYMKLQKISDYDAQSDSPTKCEFLKLKIQSRYKRRSIWANEALNTSIIDRGVIPILYKEVVPRKQSPNFGWGNNTPSLTVGNSTSIRTSGRGNFVGDSKNVAVNGDECSIGDGCNNINIIGDAITISGGLTNVNVVGTSKRKIEESNVSYINGVRYKFGVPISRSTVIDAGQDIVLPNSSSTTIVNVVDAGEDIVINTSTNGIENVIDSGQDAILPDVPSLGIATTTVPNPRTNFSGGFDFTGSTYSVSDVVIDGKTKMKGYGDAFNI